MERLTQLSLFAERERFAVVYPDAIGNNWNDGRIVPSSRAHRENIDDVGFINVLINIIAREQALDNRRIYVTGISNGGMFSNVLGAQLSHRVAAIAPVVGGIVERTVAQFNPLQPVSVLVMQGTADPVVPFEGGVVKPGQRGSIIPTEQAVGLWVQKNGCAPQPSQRVLPSAGVRDGCRVTIYDWANGRGGSEVVYYKIEGGGHTWPGGPQYLPKFMIGPVCRQFDATSTIWQFFQTHPKQS
jgi:polyhydroxybutyrate depolymerase